MLKKEPLIKPLFQIPFLIAPVGEVLDLLTTRVNKKLSASLCVVFTPNPEQLTRSFHDAQFAKTLTQSTWNLVDGQGIVWAFRHQFKLKLERVPGRVVFHQLLQEASANAWKVFLLGGKPGSAKAISDKYQNLNTNLRLEYDAGALDIAHETREEESRVLKAIKEFAPHIIFVAYGAPWQENWIIKHRAVLQDTGVKLAMVVGGSFEYEAGLVALVPKMIEQLRLEWLWRLLHEPSRWRRQLLGLEFFWRVIFAFSMV